MALLTTILYFTFDSFNVNAEKERIGLKAIVEIFYFGCCPYSYFFAYDGNFLDETWTRTGGDFKAELKRYKVEVVEYNMLEHPELVGKLNLPINPYNPFSSFARFLIDNKEVSKEEFFQKMRETQRKEENENRNQRRHFREY